MTKADKGKKLTVAVTAKRSGYRPATTASAAARIKTSYAARRTGRP